MKYDPHGYQSKMLSMIRKVEAEEYDLGEDNCKLVLGFYRDLSTGEIGVVRVYK